MKKLLFTLMFGLGLAGLMAQPTLNLSVTDSGGAPAPGVAVFYFNSPTSFYPNGYINPPVIENFDNRAFTNASGNVSFSMTNVSANDTVFWATKDCSGNLVWGAGMTTAMNPNITASLPLSCLPGDCEVILTYDSLALPSVNLGLVQAFPLRKFSNTSLPTNIPSLWSINGNFQSGFTSADYDSITFNLNSTTAPYAVNYYRVDSLCSSVSATFGGSGGSVTPVSCNPFFFADTLGQDSLGYRVLVSDSSSSNGSIISYSLSMGDGTVLNSSSVISSHNHAYQNPGVYGICLSITAVLGNDTCSSTYCDTVVVGPPVLSCSSDFNASPLSGSPAGSRFLFTSNASTNGNIIWYSYDFGDGSATSSNVGTQTHQYSASGSYSACLTITSVLGNDTCMDTYCKTVNVNLGGGIGPVSCQASYLVDTVNSGLFQGQLILWENSSSNGNIVSYDWDFGDGTTISTRYPSHTYTAVGVYPVCLTITAIDSSGVDTCVSTFCDSIGFDANGNLVYKNMTGFTINVVDPATVNLEEQVLNESLSLYPNPSRGSSKVVWDEQLTVQELSVWSTSGQLLISEVPQGNHLEIGGLKTGVYLVKVRATQSEKTLRLLVQ